MRYAICYIYDFFSLSGGIIAAAQWVWCALALGACIFSGFVAQTLALA